MCGIIGIAGKQLKNYKEEEVELMLSSLSKRGPDDHGTISFSDCTLGQTRLSIIDLPGGHQPMRDNQRNIAITFNGEIYNYPELKRELTKKGYQFTTNSDTEVILKAYSEYGFDCPNHFNGMFAFAIWDDDKKLLFMARDRFGKKPFYYTFDPLGNFVFASEIKALFASGHIKGEVDYSAIDNYLSLLYVPPQKSIYKNIHVLKPAHYAIYNLKEIHEQRYWKLDYQPITIGYEDAKERVRAMLLESVRKRLVADVEVGTMLSGGVDSTMITYLARSLQGRRVKTFAVGFEDYINELPFAKEAAVKFDTDHYELQMDINIAEQLQKISKYFDEPHADASTIPTYLISQLARKKVKVLLSGDGGDELFLGYGWYFAQWNWNIETKKRIIQAIAKKVLLNPFYWHIRSIVYFQKAEKMRLWQDKKYANSQFATEFSDNPKLTSIEKINLYDLNMYLAGDLLAKVDRASMMTSVEVRCPFLDHELAEFVYNLPLEYKTDKKIGKIILKDLLSEVMPKEFVHRRKQGFGPPLKHWLQKNELKNLVNDLFIASDASVYNFLEKKYVRELINGFYAKNKKRDNLKIWILLCLELWFRDHKKFHA